MPCKRQTVFNEIICHLAVATHQSECRTLGGKRRLEATKRAPDTTCVECNGGGREGCTPSDATVRGRRGKCLGAVTPLHGSSHQTVTVPASTFELLAYQCIPTPGTIMLWITGDESN